MPAQKILVVDADTATIARIAEHFRGRGLAVLSSRDASEAVEIFRRERPNLVVMEIMLPRTDGFALARRLREETRLRFPVIFYSRIYKHRTLPGREMSESGALGFFEMPREEAAFQRKALKALGFEVGGPGTVSDAIPLPESSRPHPAGETPRPGIQGVPESTEVPTPVPENAPAASPSAEPPEPGSPTPLPAEAPHPSPAPPAMAKPAPIARDAAPPADSPAAAPPQPAAERRSPTRHGDTVDLTRILAGMGLTPSPHKKDTRGGLAEVVSSLSAMATPAPTPVPKPKATASDAPPRPAPPAGSAAPAAPSRTAPPKPAPPKPAPPVVAAPPEARSPIAPSESAPPIVPPASVAPPPHAPRPVAPRPAAPRPAATPDAPKPSAAGPRKPMRLLLVESDPLAERILRSVFDKENVELLKASDPRSALDQMKARPFDAILINAHLGGTLGLDLAAAIRREEVFAATVLVLIREPFRKIDHERLAALSCDAVIRKPFNSGQLVRTLRDLVAAKAAGPGPGPGGAAPRARERGPR